LIRAKAAFASTPGLVAAFTSSAALILGVPTTPTVQTANVHAMSPILLAIEFPSLFSWFVISVEMIGLTRCRQRHLNDLARFWEGEPTGEPRCHQAPSFAIPESRGTI
jgi:hypothetical protein